MSDSVVISKELRDELENLISRAPRVYPSDKRDVEEAIQALRAAPETVSLEGVERHCFDVPRFEDDENETVRREFIRVSDLSNLVAAAQPSAVVSREAIADCIASARREYNVSQGFKALPDFANGETAPSIAFAADFIADKVHALLLERQGAKP